jgi:hypothetical protein
MRAAAKQSASGAKKCAAHSRRARLKGPASSLKKCASNTVSRSDAFPL